ncbi:hypothetical protein [Haloarchaeobius sp. HRN-SO-5]|uniref:hypothetical protein n=1 Tax=Haloarchaeobius sp. HRN-SO-5 TaxID=3446118 RepID=UPI003EC121F0
MSGDDAGSDGRPPVKKYGPGDAADVHRWSGGLTWIAHPDETMHRASHALAVGPDGAPVVGRDPPSDAAVWLVEPIHVDGLDELLAELGTVAGVVVLAGLHRRDNTTIADRHDVPVYLPGTVAGLRRRIDAPVEVFEGRLPGTTYRAVPVLDGVPWSEAVLYDEGTGTLVATEVLVTSDRATGRGEPLSVGPYARLQPPRAELGDLHVERVLVGHGAPLCDDARSALDHALARSFRGIPGYLLDDVAFMLRAGYVAMRD